MAVSTMTAVFWVAVLCGLVKFTDISEELDASIIRVISPAIFTKILLILY
jgi:hypothetical protein